MENDKHFRELIKQAVEQTPDDFTANIMQRIEAYEFRPNEVPLHKQTPFRLLSVAFILICIVLVVLGLVVKPELPIRFTLQIPVSYFSQITWFVVVFWVVMLVNEFFHNRQNDYHHA